MPAIWGAVIGAGVSYYNNKKTADANKKLAAGAAGDAAFKPYTYAGSSFGRTTFTTSEDVKGNYSLLHKLRKQGHTVQEDFDGQNIRGFVDPTTGTRYELEESARHTNDPRVQQAVDVQMSTGNKFLERADAMAGKSPEEMGQEEYDRYRAYTRPQQQKLLDAGMAGQIAQGTLGSRDGRGGGNPLVESMAAGFADSDYRAWGASIDRAMSRMDQYQKMAMGAWTGAGAVEGLGRTDVEIGAELGGRSARAAGTGAQLQAEVGLAGSMAERRGNQAIIDGGMQALDSYQRAQNNPRSSDTGPAYRTSTTAADESWNS